MTFMPNFIQSTLEFPHQYHMDLETELLRVRSTESLSRILVDLNLTTSASIYKTRLEAELQILEDKKSCGYFLIVADYVHWAKDNGIAVGPGRGSGPCSLVGFVLGITQVDPIKYGLPFERFVNPQRTTLPDFDLDFCAERYTEVTNYILSKYGASYVAQISSDDGTPRPSRLVICDRPLTDLVSLYSNPESGFPVTKMNIAQVKDAGLVQFNVINQKVLTLNQRAAKELAKSGITIDPDNMDFNDEDTYRLLSLGEPSNISVHDSEQYQASLINIQPDCLDHVSAAIALSYPTLHVFIPKYAERKHNPAQVSYIHPAVEGITAETYGLILYQEQVMQIIHEIAGLSLAESDTFRRKLKKLKLQATATDECKDNFVNGAMIFGLSMSEASDLFNHIELAATRTFNKSHAVAFAMIAYQTAWLKTVSRAAGLGNSGG